MKKRLKTALALLLLAALLTACGAPAAEAEPWDEAGVSEAFYKVAEDFAARFLTLDADGARYDAALDAAARYLDGALTQEEARSALDEAITAAEAALAEQEEVALPEELTAQLQTLGISAAEYELFANCRAEQLLTQQARLESLTFYLENAPAQADALENLRFFLAADSAEQEGLRGYYYYGSFNYWFPWADEAELACLQSMVTDRLEAYLPADAVWYTDAEAVEERVMLYLDDVEAVLTLASEHLGQSQTELYEMEQDYAALLELVEKNRALQEQLSALMELEARLDALSADIAEAQAAGDEEELARLGQELEALAAEYEALASGGA